MMDFHFENKKEIAMSVGSGLLGDQAYSTVFLNSRIKQLVPEFHCSIPFEQGIAGTIAFLDAHPERQ